MTSLKDDLSYKWVGDKLGQERLVLGTPGVDQVRIDVDWTGGKLDATVTRHGVAKPASPQDYKVMRLAMLQELRNVPLLKEYMQALLSVKENSFHNTEPWHAVGEQLLVAFHLLLKGNAQWHPSHAVDASIEGDDDTAVVAAMLALRAIPCLWAIHIEQIATEQPIPPYTVGPDCCPWTTGLFISRETCLVVQDKDYGKAVQSNWMLVTPLKEYLVLLYDQVDTDLHVTRVVHEKVQWGQLIENDALHIFRMLGFMQSDYVGKMERHVPRHIQRRSERAGATAHSQVAKPVLQVELLRRARQQASGSQYKEGEHREVEWNWQWWVRGHWRRLSNDDGTQRLTYVRPYLKGPDDKPILQHIYKVAR